MALHRDWDTEGKLFVHNLEDEDTEEMLTEIFGRYGEIKNVILSKDVSPGWAFIEYSTEHMAMLAAKSLDGIIGKVFVIDGTYQNVHHMIKLSTLKSCQLFFSPSKSQV